MGKANDQVRKDLVIDDLEEGAEQQPAPGGIDPVSRSSKRSKLERYLDILKVVAEHGPIKRTHILYRANLAWGELRDSLEALQQSATLSRVVTKKGMFYEITESGKKTLAYYADIQSSLNETETTEFTKTLSRLVKTNR